MTTEEVIVALDGIDESEKLTAWDAVVTAGLAAALIGACGLVHVVALSCAG